MKAPIFLSLCMVLTVSCGDPDTIERSKVAAAQKQISLFGISLTSFAEDCGRYPTSTEGLKALIERPGGVLVERWHGPYFELIPQDPWAHDYVYRCPGTHSTNHFDLYSYGPDGISRTGGDDLDDVNSWKPKPGLPH